MRDFARLKPIETVVPKDVCCQRGRKVEFSLYGISAAATAKSSAMI